MSRLYTTRRLAIGNVANVGPAFGQRLRVREGCAWITQGDERDLVVAVGEEIFLDGPGTVLVTALAGAVLFEIEEVGATTLAA